MPLARVVRHSPLYLYLKLYTLSLLVTIFASAPVTGRLNREHLQRIEQIRSVAADTFRRKAAGNGGLLSSSSLAALVPPSEWRAAAAGKAAGSPSNHRSPDTPSKPSKRHSKSTSPFPYAIKTLSLDADTAFPALPLRSAYQKTARVVRRWGRRLQDLSRVKGAVHADQHNTKRFPELLMHAQVRCSHGAHLSEQRFVQSRSQHIVESRVLAAMLQGSASADDADTHTTDVRNVPTLAIGGSGGGYRATYGFMSSLAALQSRGVLQATHWLAGVSGSCWTIASLYTVSTLDVGKLIKHCKKVAREGFHPMSRQALDVVARSSKGVYFLLAPLLSKVRNGVVGIGIMDMYATLTTSYQLLSRSAHARPRLSRSTFQFSKMWDRVGLSEGRAPMPIFTAVRVKYNEQRQQGRGLEKWEEAADDAGQPLVPTHLDREKAAFKARQKAFAGSQGAAKYQWWEMNPLEVGSSDEGAWVPTWAYGRSFVRGSSVSTAPEISLSLLLGQATSAPAGPLTGYITTLLATLPQGTLMSLLLSKVNSFVQQKRWERRWGNPIRGADEPNPIYGHGRCPASDREWEGRGRLKLMDSGLSNNLPNHIFTCAARRADIIVSFDQSSDVQTGAALVRLNDFAVERNLLLVPEESLPPLPPHPLENGKRRVLSAAEIQDRFRGRYAQVFCGWYRDRHGNDTKMEAGLQDRDRAPTHDPPHLHIVYCPLLPHHSQPEYDPVTAPFSTSYNLVWRPDEIETIARTATANTVEYVIPTLQRIYQTVYESKRAERK